MRIAVCDDEAACLDRAERLVRRVAPEYFEELQIDAWLDNLKMLDVCERNPYDIVVMDIQMEPLDGFRAAERLKELGQECRLIFLSSKEELVFQSFSYEPVYFVRKGTVERMEAELRRAFERIREKYHRRVFLHFTDRDGMVEKVSVADIESVQSNRNYLLYTTLEGRQLRIRKTMEEEEASLKAYGFLRIHRAFLVNTKYVSQVKRNGTSLKMRSGSVFEVGRNYRESVLRYFFKE